jgi:hypothetical protein
VRVDDGVVALVRRCLDPLDAARLALGSDDVAEGDRMRRRERNRRLESIIPVVQTR